MTILWDWNGTLLDDVQLTLDLENRLFKAHGYPTIGLAEYRQKFCFPVLDYYRALGVRDEDFPPIADAWAIEYRTASQGCPLAKTALETAKRFQQAGFRQVILSASKQSMLSEQVASYPELDGVFDEILGIADHYAASKVQLALDYLHRGGVDPQDAVFLGDTLHDAEVAAAIGCRCMLISGGHQSDEVLARAGVPVMPSLAAAASALLT